MIRDKLAVELKDSLKEKNALKSSTLRLIIAALKDRDIAARSSGNQDGIPDQEILKMLQTMIKQRRESVKLYEQGARVDLADREKKEIEIIQEFLPEQINDDKMEEIVAKTISEIEATGLKDMGNVMAHLREEFAGQMDFGKASQIVKKHLS